MMIQPTTPALFPRRGATVLVEPPPEGYTGSAESYKEIRQAMCFAAGPIAGLILGVYAGMNTGVAAGVCGALALGAAGSAAGFMAGQYSDLLNGMAGRNTDHYKLGLVAGTLAGATGGALLGASVSNPWVAGGLAVAGALGATYWTMLALGK
jgi:hypothetical protein